MKCRLCNREVVSDLHRHHEKTRRRVEAGYRLWAEAYEEMKWKDCLDKVKRSDQTGQWAKEIAKKLEGL